MSAAISSRPLAFAFVQFKFTTEFFNSHCIEKDIYILDKTRTITEENSLSSLDGGYFCFCYTTLILLQPSWMLLLPDLKKAQEGLPSFQQLL